MKDFIDFNISNMDDLIKHSETVKEKLEEEIMKAVERATFKGIRWIMEDTPIDTGRLKSSIAGKYGSDMLIEGEADKISLGRKESLTDINKYSSTIGTKVKYAKHVEYGHKYVQNRKLTPKQLRYLFAMGILKSVNGKVVSTNIHKRINYRGRMQGKSNIISRSKGKGMFRKNIPKIQKYFDEQMKAAIDKVLK